jgi:hypothetical protein
VNQSHSTTCRVSISAVRSILRQRVHRPPLRGVLLHAAPLHEVLQHGDPLFQLFSLAQREFSECLDDIAAKRAGAKFFSRATRSIRSISRLILVATSAAASFCLLGVLI